MLQVPAPHTVAGTPPLIQRLIAQNGARWVGNDPADPWLAQDGDCALFIAGDPVRFPECLDVAVVLPELQRAGSRPFRIAIAERDAEDALAARFGAARRPSLVFLRGGRYVATVAGMLDWDDYVREVERALQSPVSRAPIGIAVAASAGGCQ